MDGMITEIDNNIFQNIKSISFAKYRQKMFNKMRNNKDSKRNFDEAQRQVIYRRDNGTCKICGRKCEWNDWEADHIVPWSKGGKSTPDNCQMLCTKCNLAKSNH